VANKVNINTRNLFEITKAKYASKLNIIIVEESCAILKLIRVSNNSKVIADAKLLIGLNFPRSDIKKRIQLFVSNQMEEPLESRI
jgi:hypothetical protein